jgi:tRNA A-37 threonylcarbamoyl transferase component Bud32
LLKRTSKKSCVPKVRITFAKVTAKAASAKEGGGRTSDSTKKNLKPEEQGDSSFSSQVIHWTKKMANCTGALPSGFQHQDATKPPRNRGAYRQTDHDPYNVQKKMSNSDEFDNHTLSTASTSAATSSYSMTDDASEASEIGMEVSMSPREFVNEDAVDATPFTHHSFTAGKEIFSIDTRYKMIRTVGSGAYGTVISATDSKKERKVAIKMIPRAFNDEIDAKRILREIKLMKHFQHDNIVGILDMMPPQSKFVEDFNDVYIVGELMETDLHRIIYSKQPLSIDHVQYFVYQILRGMKYIHSANVIHRDLKPSNLLVNANCDLKICDFGLARGILGDHQQRGEPLALTEYVVTRWYRAPEIMLACHEYSKPIDVWSIGCIFAELILRKPYFPGNDYIDQVRIPDLLYRL